MTSAASSPDIPPLKKDTISFAPPPPELNLTRTSIDTPRSSFDAQQPLLQREHPELSHRRSSSADGAGSTRRSRVMGSPPPPPSYTPRVSFDTFDSQDATTFALTLRSKHRMYRYHHSSRTFLLGLDHKDYSQYALEWGMKELFEDNDEIVILRVIDSAEKAQLEAEGRGEEKAYQVEAKRLLDSVISQNKDEKAVNVIVELVVGRFQDQVQRMIQIYSPDSLIVGTRGRDGAIGGLLPGSMSKYCLQHSPVPVVVVHPYQRRMHRKHKRQQDPDRQSYIHLLKLAKAYSSSDNDSLIPSPITSDTIIPEINLDTPGTLSPDDDPLTTTKSDSQVLFNEHDLSGDDRPALRHAVTAPGCVDIHADDKDTIAMDRESENVSPTDKG